MEREAFAKVMQEVMDSLPEEFRSRIRNVAVPVEDYPPGQTPSPTQRNSCWVSFTECP
jgi:predicted Zn-dependent protease with MMP-like domain